MADAGELKLHLERISARSLILDTQKVYAHRAAQRKVKLEVKVPEWLPEIEADAPRIKEVFANILENALRYTPPGGLIALSGAAVDHAVEFRVADSGHGVAPAELQLIFERFHRAENSRSREDGGSGLGLAIAKSIVERHQGTIWAESKPGAGLTIIFRIPSSSPKSQ